MIEFTEKLLDESSQFISISKFYGLTGKESLPKNASETNELNTLSFFLDVFSIVADP